MRLTRHTELEQHCPKAEANKPAPGTLTNATAILEPAGRQIIAEARKQ